jgi:hypothetical protein
MDPPSGIPQVDGRRLPVKLFLEIASAYESQGLDPSSRRQLWQVRVIAYMK